MTNVNSTRTCISSRLVLANGQSEGHPTRFGIYVFFSFNFLLIPEEKPSQIYQPSAPIFSSFHFHNLHILTLSFQLLSHPSFSLQHHQMFALLALILIFRKYELLDLCERSCLHGKGLCGESLSQEVII